MSRADPPQSSAELRLRTRPKGFSLQKIANFCILHKNTE